jgi:hypothetical protein
MSGEGGNGRTRFAIVGVLCAAALTMASWTLTEVASLKERAARGESEREAGQRLISGIADDVREMRADIKKLLERR